MLTTEPDLLKLPQTRRAAFTIGDKSDVVMETGIYNLTQPEMSDELLARKMKHIRSTGCEVVATGNPGCLLQLLDDAGGHAALAFAGARGVDQASAPSRKCCLSASMNTAGGGTASIFVVTLDAAVVSNS